MSNLVKPVLPAQPLPNFESATFLRTHIQDILNFYKPNTFDSAGGFFHYYRDDGSIYNRTHRHLVSATRLVFNWVQAWQQTDDPTYLAWAQHALNHLDTQFKTPAGVDVWALANGCPEDSRIMAYGQAFVRLWT